MSSERQQRVPLSRERVLAAARDLCDAEGLAGLSMRRIAERLGVEAMSLYHHVDGKDALLDALADEVLGQVDLPGAAQPWRAAMAARAGSARQVLGAHPWAIGLVESRSAPGPALLRHHDAVLANLLGNGFPHRLAMHAFCVLDAYVYGFVVTEQHLPFDLVGGQAEYAAGLVRAAGDQPHLTAVLVELRGDPGYRFADEFEHGLVIVLDGLQARLDTGAAS